MLELGATIWLAAAIPGGLVAVATLLAAWPTRPPEALAWLRLRGLLEAPKAPARQLPRPLAETWRYLERQCERAGLPGGAVRLALVSTVMAGSLSLAGFCAGALLVDPTVGTALALLGLGGGAALAAWWLVSTAAARRSRLLAELLPTLELLGLEISAGGTALAALGAIVARTQGELAAELRRLLIGSQVAGSEAADTRLASLAERLDLPPLGTLAAVLGSSREYGSAALPGVRALARDLRQRQRRELIMLSRRALNRVLIPAAAGVLLPFMAILLFPAVATLAGSFR